MSGLKLYFTYAKNKINYVCPRVLSSGWRPAQTVLAKLNMMGSARDGVTLAMIGGVVLFVAWMSLAPSPARVRIARPSKTRMTPREATLNAHQDLFGHHAVERSHAPIARAPAQSRPTTMPKEDSEMTRLERENARLRASNERLQRRHDEQRRRQAPPPSPPAESTTTATGSDGDGDGDVSACDLYAPPDATTVRNYAKLMRILKHEQPRRWFAHGGHAISAMRIGSPVMFFEKENKLPIYMDVDYDHQVLVPNQSYWLNHWGPLMNARVKAAFGNSVYVQSKIYPKNSYKIFKFCPTNTRMINPLGHGSGNSCMGEFRALYIINKTHVTTKQECAVPPTKKGPCNPQNVKPLSRIFPLGKAKWGPLEIPVPRDPVLAHALDLEVNGKEFSPHEIALWEKPVKILQKTFSDRTHCIAQLRPGSSFSRSALRFLDSSCTRASPSASSCGA